MDWQIAWIVFTALASGHIMFNVGRRMGIENTLDYLKQKGDIDFDD